MKKYNKYLNKIFVNQLIYHNKGAYAVTENYFREKYPGNYSIAAKFHGGYNRDILSLHFHTEADQTAFLLIHD